MNDSKNTVAISKVISKYFEKKQINLFCGAGISFHSGIPIANNIIYQVLYELRVSNDEIQKILKLNFPFEAFFEIFAEQKEPEQLSSINELLKIFQSEYTSTTHQFIALLAKLGVIKTIFTTNFDELIERALEEEGLTKGNDFIVHHRDLEKIDLHNNKVKLIKLHGTMSDLDSIQILLKSVSRNKVSQGLINVLRSEFNPTSTTVFLGYSFSDQFDIRPVLKSIPNPGRILVVNHNLDVEEVSNLSSISNEHPFEQAEGHFLNYDTDKLIKKLWPKMVTKEYLFRQYKDVEWKRFIKSWVSNDINPYQIIGSIYLYTTKFNKAINSYEKAMQWAKSKNRNLDFSINKFNLTTVYCIIGKYSEAIKLTLECVEDFQKYEESRGLIQAYRQLGVIYKNLKRYDESITYYKKVIDLIRNKDAFIVSQTECNLGILFLEIKDFQEAESYLNRALSKAKKNGFIRIELSAIIPKGVLHEIRGEFDKAIKYAEMAYQLADNLGSSSEKGNSLMNKASVLIKMSKKHNATRLYEKALGIFADSGHTKSKVKCLLNLSICYHHLPIQAITYLDRALRDLEDSNSTVLKFEILSSKGVLLTKMKRFPQSIRCHQEAYSIAKNEGTIELMIEAKVNLGTTNNLAQEFQSSLKEYSEAIKLIENHLIYKDLLATLKLNVKSIQNILQQNE